MPIFYVRDVLTGEWTLLRCGDKLLLQSAGLFVTINNFIIEIQTMQNEVQALNASEKRPKYSPTNKKQSAVDIVINKIVDDVLTGHYKPGDKLPTEMQLAEMMSMSKNTVREAIKILVAYGAVEIRRPEGTFIADSFTPKMLNPVIYSLLFSKSNADDLLGLRRMIDTGVFLLIIDRGLDKEDEAALEAQHKFYSSLVLSRDADIEMIAREDICFHQMLAAATKNELVKVFHDYVADLTSESRVRAIEMCRRDNNMQYLVDVHRATMDLVERKSKYSLEETIDFSYIYWKSTYKLEILHKSQLLNS